MPPSLPFPFLAFPCLSYVARKNIQHITSKFGTGQWELKAKLLRYLPASSGCCWHLERTVEFDLMEFNSHNFQQFSGLRLNRRIKFTSELRQQPIFFGGQCGLRTWKIYKHRALPRAPAGDSVYRYLYISDI